MKNPVIIALFLAFLRLVGHFTDPYLSDAQIHQLTGDPARVMAAKPGPIKIVTWNIERGLDYAAVERDLRQINADVVLLQEADMFCRRSGNRHIARDLAHALHMNWVAAGEFQEIGEASNGIGALTGQAVLSKEPIVDAAVIVFTSQSTIRWRLSPVQPRRGGRIALSVRTAGIRFYDAHLESGGTQNQRTRQLADILGTHERTARHAEPAVIAGDFNNEPTLRAEMFSSLDRGGFTDALGAVSTRVTSARHQHPIDWIFTSHLEAHDGFIGDTGHASDHYPLIVTVEQR